MQHHLVVQRADLRDLRLGRLDADQFASQRLERPEHQEDFAHTRRIDERDERTPVGLKFDQALRGEELDRLAQGRARDAKPLGQHALVQLHTGREFTLDDHVPQPIDAGHVQQAALDR